MSDDNPSSTATGELDGQTLGQYQIERQVGQGGMASVYLAKQGSIGRTVAIKVMPMYFMHDPNFLSRFEREVQVIAKLQHPRILPVYDYGQINGRPYIVMAYMPGGTLADLIEKGPMPLDQVTRLVDQIAEGLDFAHREGVIHRDFKPSNVLLDRAGNAHLADFGIAKISEQTVALTGSGIVGTPAYMAPEMASEGIVTPAVDIYALGVTLYQMLTGRYPYHGDTPLRVMMAHATEPVPDVRQVRADLPAGIAAIVQKAMAKDPAQRYPDSASMATALRAVASGQPLPAGTPVPASDVKTVLESAPAQAVRTPTPPPATPAPSYTPPPGVAQTGGTPYPGTLPKSEQKRGCLGPALIVGGILAVATIVCVALVGVGGIASLLSFSTTPTPTPPEATPFVIPTDTPTEIPATDEVLAGSPLVVFNQTSQDVCYLYFADSGMANWGADVLTVDNLLPAGSQTTVDIPVGVYDVKAEDCDYNTIDWTTGLNIDGTSALDITGYKDALEIENNSSDDICALYISIPDSSEWGRSLIEASQAIPAGSTRTFAIPGGNYDLRTETCDGRNAERYNEDITGTVTWTITD